MAEWKKTLIAKWRRRCGSTNEEAEVGQRMESRLLVAELRRRSSNGGKDTAAQTPMWRRRI